MTLQLKSLKKKLDEQRALNGFRYVSKHETGVDFESNDYLGIAKRTFKSDLAHGSTGSRLISGHFEITEKLEEKAVALFGQKTATLYCSGYDANVGFFSCVPLRGDAVIFDELCHASIRDGISLGFAKGYKFKHNDIIELEKQIVKQLEKVTGNVFLCVESIYSMDGDEAPLVEIAKLCEKYNVFLIVDEAHSGGLYGENGEGIVSMLGLDDIVFAKLMTFSKAYGSHGAIYLGDENLHDYLINFSRSLIYTSSLPPHCQDRICTVMDQVKNADKEREILKENITFFIQEAYKQNVNLSESETAIQVVIIPGNKALLLAAKKVIDAGFLIKPIIAPTVPLGEERLRICLHSYNTKEEISTLIDLLK